MGGPRLNNNNPNIIIISKENKSKTLKINKTYK